MVYGVDLPTEIAYTYRISDNNNPGPPILDEIFYEEPSRRNQNEELRKKLREKRKCATKTKTKEGDNSIDEECEGVSQYTDDDILPTEDWESLVEALDVLEQVEVDILEESVANTDDVILGKKSVKALIVSDKKDLAESKSSTPSGMPGSNNEVYAVKRKSQSFSSSQKRYVRSEDLVHSGDNTVPYVSLSHAKKWLDDDSSSSTKDKELNKRWTENRAEVTHKSILDSWATLRMASAVTSVDPAVDMFHSVRANGDTTVVMELAGVDHLDIAKHPYVHFLLFENLLSKMSTELCLNVTDTTCQNEYLESEVKDSFFGFSKRTPDIQLLGRKISKVAGQVVEILKKKVRQ